MLRGMSLEKEFDDRSRYWSPGGRSPEISPDR